MPSVRWVKEANFKLLRSAGIDSASLYVALLAGKTTITLVPAGGIDSWAP
jgi:hypothetical protein